MAAGLDDLGEEAVAPREGRDGAAQGAFIPEWESRLLNAHAVPRRSASDRSLASAHTRTTQWYAMPSHPSIAQRTAAGG